MANDAALIDLPRRRGIGGFTLIEILVTIGIITVLASLLLPMVMRARRQAVKIKAQGTLQTLSTGLEAYQQAWGAYPAFNISATATTTFDVDNKAASWDGGPRSLFAGLVCRWSQRKGSEPYGPFVNVDNLKVDRTNMWVDDGVGRPVLYVPAATPRPDITKMVGVPGGTTIPGFCWDSSAASAQHGPIMPMYDHRAAALRVITPGMTNYSPPPAGPVPRS